MATSWLTTSWDFAVQIYNTYPLHGWPLIYYPLFYLGQAIKQERLKSDGEYEAASRYTIICAIAVLAVWMLGQNCVFLLRDILKRRGPPIEPGSEFEDDHVDLRYDGTRTRVVVSKAHQDTDVSCGLSTSEVVRRRELYGPGEGARVGAWYHALIYATTRSSFLPAMVCLSLGQDDRSVMLMTFSSRPFWQSYFRIGLISSSLHLYLRIASHRLLDPSGTCSMSKTVS